MGKRQKIDIVELYDYLTGRLPASDQERIDAALASDPRLREKMGALTDVHDALAAEADRPTPKASNELHRRIVNEARNALGRRGRGTLRPFRRTAVAWGIATAAAVLIAVGLMLSLQSRPQTPAGPLIVRPTPDPDPDPAVVLADGQVLQTTNAPLGGQLASGATVLLDRGSRVTILRSAARSGMIRLERGQVFLRNPATELQIATPQGTVTCYGSEVECNLRLSAPTDPVRVAHAAGPVFLPVSDAPSGPALVASKRLYLTVVRGVVVFTNKAGHTTVRRGQTVRCDGSFTVPHTVRLGPQRAIAWTLSDEQLATLPASVLGEVMHASLSSGGSAGMGFTYPFSSRNELDDFIFYPSASRATVRMDRGLHKPGGKVVPLMAHQAQFDALDEVAWWGHLGAGRPTKMFVNLGDAAQIEMRFDGTHCHLAVITKRGRIDAGRIRIEGSPRYSVRLRRESGRWILRCNGIGIKTLPADALGQIASGRVSISLPSPAVQVIGLEIRGKLRISWLRNYLAETSPR